VYTVVKLGQKIQAGFNVNIESYNEFTNQEPKHSNSKTQEVVERFNLNCSNNGLDKLSTYEQQLLRLFRSFKNDRELTQDLYDFVCDLFISHQSRSLKKIKRN
jgi:hypothetical protein